MKPRIVTLLCVTGVFSLLAAGGAPIPILSAFIVAGACIAASAAAFNCWYDRNLDKRMERTAQRPLPSGELDHRIAFAFAVLLLVVGSTVGVVVLPLKSVVYMWLGMAAYVGLYTILLKRRHWLGVVLGGSAGSFPVLAGWTAIRPLEPSALVFALLVFAWTPAHAWALAYVYESDFAAADIPTLPVVATEQRLRRVVWMAATSTVLVALVAIPFTTPPYTVASIIAGGLFLLGYHEFYRTGTKRAAVRAFFTSNLYLAVLFLAWALGGLTTEVTTVIRSLAVICLPILFVQLWRVQPSLRGVSASTGDEWAVVTEPVRTRLWIEISKYVTE